MKKELNINIRVDRYTKNNMQYICDFYDMSQSECLSDVINLIAVLTRTLKENNDLSDATKLSYKSKLYSMLPLEYKDKIYSL